MSESWKKTENLSGSGTSAEIKAAELTDEALEQVCGGILLTEDKADKNDGSYLQRIHVSLMELDNGI